MHKLSYIDYCTHHIDLARGFGNVTGLRYWTEQREARMEWDARKVAA